LAVGGRAQKDAQHCMIGDEEPRQTEVFVRKGTAAHPQPFAGFEIGSFSSPFTAGSPALLCHDVVGADPGQAERFPYVLVLGDGRIGPWLPHL